MAKRRTSPFFTQVLERDCDGGLKSLDHFFKLTKIVYVYLVRYVILKSVFTVELLHQAT
jgi:hypothetical protein